MKKFLLIAFLLVCGSLWSFAQRFEGGVIAGINASQVDGDFTSGYHKPGIVAGAYVLTDLSRNVFTGMEIKFSQKGSRKNPNFKTGDQEKYIMRLNYIDIPVYVGVRTSERISVFGGLSAGYLMKAAEYDNHGLFAEEDQADFNDIDVQGMLGFRFQLTNRITADLRGAYSILPIREQPGNVSIYWLDSQFSNLLSTTILYRLDF